MIKKIFLKIIYLPFLLPIIYRVKFPIGNLESINLLDLVLFFSITLGLILIIKEKKWDDFRNRLMKNKIAQGIGFFLLFGGLSLLANPGHNQLRGLGLLKSFFVLPILFTIIIGYFRQKKQINFWLFFQCYFTYSIFLGLFAIISKVINHTTFDNRVQLFFSSPNQLAIALSIGIISGLLLKLHQVIKIHLLLILLLGLALLLTQSTGAIVAVSLVTLVIYYQKKLPALNLLIKYLVFLSLVSVLFILLLNPFLNKINYNPFLNQSSSDSRLVIYLSSQKIILNNFINGIGIANFQEKYLENQTFFPPYPQWAVPHAHNLFLQIWLSFGFLGLITWVYCLYKKTVPAKNLSAELFSYFILYFLIHGLIDVPIWNNDQALFFWFIFLF